MADDEQGTYEEGLYSEEELASFGIWVEIGAKNPDQQRFLDVGLSVTWERREPSGSPWVMRLLRNPVPALREAGVPGVHKDSRVTTTILHHHRGLFKKIIRIKATVEQQTGDVALELDKETEENGENGDSD
jgi:hypothetical protein